MKKLNLFFALCTSLSLYACQHKGTDPTAQASRPKTAVQVVNVETGSVNDNLELSATSVYLRRNMITSPIPAFITKVYIRLGGQVRKGQVLYELETKERRALGSDASRIDTSLRNFGM
ncbi:MAG: hypothetical protein ACYCZO_14125, partial [Daejeonella sp.]